MAMASNSASTGYNKATAQSRSTSNHQLADDGSSPTLPSQHTDGAVQHSDLQCRDHGQHQSITTDGPILSGANTKQKSASVQVIGVNSNVEGQQQHTLSAQNPRPKSNKTNKASPSFLNVILVWWPELLAATLAVILLVTEIILLAHYDNKMLLRHWPHDWQINAVFAFLTALLEACLTFFVGACIGQLRWHWYRKKAHSLEWLDLMSDARQPSGATRLLFRRGAHKQFAIIGALIVILLVGVSTFTQNVIVHINEDVQLGDHRGGIPTNTNYTWYTAGSSLNVSDQKPLPQMGAAAELGLYTWSEDDTGATVINRITSWCDGDKCEFGTYQTLAVCSMCSDRVEANNPCPGGGCTADDYYTLDGVVPSLAATNGVVNITSDTQYPHNSALREAAGPLIFRMDALIADDAFSTVTGQGASGLECAAWWCIKTFSGKIVNGTVSEDLQSEWTNQTEEAKTVYLQEENIYMTPPECWHNNTNPRNESFCTYIAGAKTQAGLQNLITGGEGNLTDDFNALLTGSTVYYGEGENTTWDYTSLLAGGLLATGTDEASLTDKLRRGFETMANYMTVSLREQIASDGSSQYAYGNATIHEIVFYVEWGWLAYPVSLVVLSIAFLFGTMFISRDEEAWKGSALAMMFHSFDDQDREGFQRDYNLDNVDGMRAFVRQKKAKLAGQNGRLLFKQTGEKPASERVDEMRLQTSGAGSHLATAGMKFYDGMS